MHLQIRQMAEADITVITDCATQQGWKKPDQLYRNYYNEQTKGLRIVLVAFEKNVFVGYLTILWKSYYPSFLEKGIPEIMDFNVLKQYRHQGIGSQLMDEAEKITAQKYPVVGISVGLYSDYGTAQRMYVKRGYIPDGLGIFYNEKQINAGDTVIVNDDLTLAFTKRLFLKPII
jgi:ribosomal protein S18 acetylase RimI-like enzyme